MQPVSMADDAFALDVIENLADLGRCALAVIEKRNKVGDGALEVDVVFPERVIGVNQQRLRRCRIPDHKNMILRSSLRKRGTTAEKSMENVCC